MKVFRMNEYDWVCAESEEQAKEYYQWETGKSREEIDTEFIGEVPLTEKMLYPVDDLPWEKQQITQTDNTDYFYGELCVWMPFKWVIEHENITRPQIIASTEF